MRESSLSWDGGGQSFRTKHPSVTSVNYLDKLKDETESKRVSYLNNPSLIEITPCLPRPLIYPAWELTKPPQPRSLIRARSGAQQHPQHRHTPLKGSAIPARLFACPQRVQSNYSSFNDLRLSQGTAVLFQHSCRSTFCCRIQGFRQGKVL